MRHIIQIDIEENLHEFVTGLPKNWKIEIRDFDVDEDDPFAKVDDRGKRYLETILKPHCGEFVAPKLSLYELKLLHGHIKMHVETYGFRNFKSILSELERCLGY